MKKLYDFCLDDDIRKKELYIKENNECIDLVTYFNSFSPKKWNKYTNVKRIGIQIEIEGQGLIQVIGFSLHREKIVFEELTGHRFTWESDVNTLDYDVLGIRIIKKSPNVSFISGMYMGECKEGSDFNHPKIAIAICTYKREEYLKKNLVLLRKIVDSNRNYSVTVIDNGNTLEEKDDNGIRIIHNLNYGGSGGFTRGLIENVDDHDYIILMDDDIEIGPGVLEKTYTFLSVIKDEYKESFIGGAMLNMDAPLIQSECNAIWKVMRTKVNGRNFNLSKTTLLEDNEKFIYTQMTYAGWWFCTVPSDTVKKIGYPLPIFIKGDDTEYSLRNKKEIITLNGIGVWHEPFKKKNEDSMFYYWARNSAIIGSIIYNSRLYFLMLIIYNFLKCLYKKQKIDFYYKAIKDYSFGLAEMLKLTPLVKHSELKNYKIDCSFIKKIYLILKEIYYCFIEFDNISDKNKQFLNENLKDKIFWKKLLKI